MCTAARLGVALATAFAGASTAGRLGAQGSSAPLTPFARHKAEVLLRDQLPCLGCHALGGDGGQVGPDLSTVRERRSPEYIAAMVADPQRVLPGTAMPLVRMPEATRELVVRYLASLPGSAPGGAPALQTASVTEDGPALYARFCASCHGRAGAGDGPNAKNLPVPPAKHSSAEAMAQRSDDALYDTIAGGGAVMNRSARMPPFGGTLSDPQIRALVAHIRTLCRCQGPAWSRESAQRGAPSTP
jgi:mono/diheme cytochrome c family protein